MEKKYVLSNSEKMAIVENVWPDTAYVLFDFSDFDVKYNVALTLDASAKIKEWVANQEHKVRVAMLEYKAEKFGQGFVEDFNKYDQARSELEYNKKLNNMQLEILSNVKHYIELENKKINKQIAELEKE